MTTEIRIRWASGDDDMSRALTIRERVFCDEQGVSHEEERDGLDGVSLHLLAFAPANALESADEPAIATLRLRMEGQIARIGRLAVERGWRRRGVATRMLECALQRAREAGCERARLAAQLDARRLYEKVRFAVESDVFEEAGIPHLWMGREL
jgi:predicted GNAT family N-acyltransferase